MLGPAVVAHSAAEILSLSAAVDPQPHVSTHRDPQRAHAQSSRAGVEADGRPHLMERMLRRVWHWVRNSLANENIDLYLLAVAAFVFTILGVTGVTSIAALLSMTLAVLAACLFPNLFETTRRGDSGSRRLRSPLGTAH